MKDYTKSSGSKSAVRQVKGPGMNLGLKKPRKNYIPKPKPYKPSREMKDAMSGGKASSYLPKFEEGGSVQAMDSGKGKQLSCKKY
ncbi:MAG: hypothetical protein ACR2JS_08925 [Candidatus Nanopelagicales bacterium]